MTSTLNKAGQSAAHRLLLIQALVMVLVAVMSAILAGWGAGASALTGGLICWLPNLYFARKVFQYAGAQAARQVVQGLFWGEAVKLCMTLVLFALVWRMVPVQPLALLLGFMGTQAAIWSAPWVFHQVRR